MASIVYSDSTRFALFSSLLCLWSISPGVDHELWRRASCVLLGPFCRIPGDAGLVSHIRSRNAGDDCCTNPESPVPTVARLLDR